MSLVYNNSNYLHLIYFFAHLLLENTKIVFFLFYLRLIAFWMCDSLFIFII